MAIKKCLHCGHEADESANFCPKCGQPLSSSESPEPQAPADSDPSDFTPKAPRGKSRLLWVIALLIIVVGGGSIIAYSLYNSHQSKLREDRIAEEEYEDSLATVKKEEEKEAARIEQMRRDSIEKIEFRNNFVNVKDFLTLVTSGWDETSKIPEFRGNIKSTLEKKGYVVTNTKKGKREGEGGDYYPYTITTWEKKWDKDDDSSLWSKVIDDDGICGGYTIEFCDDDALNAFLKSCKAFGYTHRSTAYGGGYRLTMVDYDYDSQLLSVYHENDNCVVTVKGKKVTIEMGCI